MRYVSELIRSWSAYVSYLILTGIPLVMALPASARVDALIEPHLNLSSIFMIIATVLFPVYSFNFGLVHARLAIPPKELRVRLFVHVLFLIVLGLPYWTVFAGMTGHGLERLVGALGYLGLYGACWAVLGVPIGRRWPTEIVQFHVKYILILIALGGTFFVLRPLNPFLMLSLWFGEGALREHVGFVLMGYLSVVTALGILSWWGIGEGSRAQIQNNMR